MYSVSEKFKSLQGEGVYAGTPMAFIRLTGCSVGKKICQHCDTDFEVRHAWRGGGTFTADQLLSWARHEGIGYDHVCITGGEPFDYDLEPLIAAFRGYFYADKSIHIETSGTREISHEVRIKHGVWICASPKPGFLESEVMKADEIKVIVPDLGTPASLLTLKHDNADRETFRWPTLEDALRWADAGKPVFLQPRNGRTDIDPNNLRIVMDILAAHPNLRLSSQLHKILKVQ
jgi:organic radical activating enzyme